MRVARFMLLAGLVSCTAQLWGQAPIHLRSVQRSAPAPAMESAPAWRSPFESPLPAFNVAQAPSAPADFPQPPPAPSGYEFPPPPPPPKKPTHAGPQAQDAELDVTPVVVDPADAPAEPGALPTTGSMDAPVNAAPIVEQQPAPVIVRDVTDATADPVPVPDGHELVEETCPCGKPDCNGLADSSREPDEAALGSEPQLVRPDARWGAERDYYSPPSIHPACEPGYSCTGPCSRWFDELFPCDRCACDAGAQRLLPDLGPCGNLEISGWLNGGWLLNGANSNFNGPVGFGDEAQLQLNQMYGVFQKRVDARDGFDIGGRIDLLWGSDYIFTETAGLERRANGGPRWNSKADYGLALPQAYLEAGWDDLTVKLGHFYTLVGYESVMAPENFFYSHSYTMLYGEPFTHTGMLASYDWSTEWTAHAGLINGWDRLDGSSDALGFLGGVNYSPRHELYDVAFSLVSSNEPNGAGGSSDRTMYSMVMNLVLTENLSYVLQHDHGWQDSYFVGGAPAEWYGINQYLFYDINACWTLGARFEWFRDDDGARVAGVRPGNPYLGNSPGDFFQVGMGVNYRPHPNLVIRPEVRWDWHEGIGVQPFDANRSSRQFLGGLDVILRW